MRVCVCHAGGGHAHTPAAEYMSTVATRRVIHLPLADFISLLSLSLEAEQPPTPAADIPGAPLLMADDPALQVLTVLIM